MGILCRLFGHRSVEGYYHDDEEGNCYRYFKIDSVCKDGMGRKHATLTTDCRRCGKNYIVGKIHLLEPRDGQ